MFTDINRQLDEARQGVFQLQKIDSMLQHLLLEQADLAEKAAQLKGKLVKEDADVERLEKRSLAALFYSALGNYIHRLEKERQEALAAKLQLKQAKSDLEDVRSEIASLRSRRQEYLDYPPPPIRRPLCPKEGDALKLW
jgi:chromosome segregation ATPase